MLRGTALGIVAAVVVTGGILGATNIRNVLSARRQTAHVPAKTANPVTIPETTSTTLGVQGTASGVAATSDERAAPSVATAPTTTVASASAPRVAPPLAPILPSGTSPIGEGITAIRTDSMVVVSFDSPLVRTRRASKFESFVRATLPAIYGHGADSVLAHVPDGSLAGQGDLFSDLPTRGMRIPAGDAWEIRLYPEARNGQDGPLIVRYRVTVVATGA